MSDLLSRIATDRSDQAFNALFAEYAPRIKSFMMRQGADAALAEELVQETLLTVWRKAGLYSASKGSAITWIFTIARNLRIDRLRRETPWQELTEEHTATLVADEKPADVAVSDKEREHRVQVVLGSLPPEQRQVIVLAFIDGLSHGDIAKQLGLPVGTVKSRIRLAYQKVRSALEDLR